MYVTLSCVNGVCTEYSKSLAWTESPIHKSPEKSQSEKPAGDLKERREGDLQVMFFNFQKVSCTQDRYTKGATRGTKKTERTQEDMNWPPGQIQVTMFKARVIRGVLLPNVQANCMEGTKMKTRAEPIIQQLKTLESVADIFLITNKRNEEESGQRKTLLCNQKFISMKITT